MLIVVNRSYAVALFAALFGGFALSFGCGVTHYAQMDQVNTLYFEITTEQTAQVRWPYCALAHSTRWDSPAPRPRIPACSAAGGMSDPIRSGPVESLRLRAFGGKG